MFSITYHNTIDHIAYILLPHASDEVIYRALGNSLSNVRRVSRSCRRLWAVFEMRHCIANVLNEIDVRAIAAEVTIELYSNFRGSRKQECTSEVSHVCRLCGRRWYVFLNQMPAMAVCC